MLRTPTMSPQLQEVIHVSVADLAISASRRIVLGVTAPLVILQLLLAARHPGAYAYPLGQTVLILLAVTAVTVLLDKKHLGLSQATWLVGFSAAVLCAVYLLQEPALALLLILSPLMAAVLSGAFAALLTGVLLGIVVWMLTAGGVMPTADASMTLMLALSGTLASYVGWTATNALLDMTCRSLADAERTHRQIEEARDQQVELKQIQEDLVQANRELARLSERLKAMNQVAEDARRVKEEFVANVSHELRTPLNMIIGFSEMITGSPEIYGPKLPPALLSDINAIQHNSQHLSELINDVLDLSRVETGRLALSKETVNIHDIVREATDTVRALFQSKKLYLRVNDNAVTPPLVCDPTRIRQVIINLLSNAGRFTGEGGVRIDMSYADSAVTVAVADTGPGISAERQAVMFEPFQQLDGSIYRRYGGSGLGLSISRKIVEMHGGRMGVESEVGQGTCVTFSLPALADIAPSQLNGTRTWVNPYQTYEPRTRPSRAPVPAAIPRYVVLEKGDVLTRLLTRYAEDIEVESVGDRSQAIEMLQRAPAQAVIINGSLAEGMASTATEMAELPFGTPVIHCWIPEADIAFERFGVVRHLIKPVTRDVLLAALDEMGNEIKTVLIVDDNAEFLQLFGRMLSTSGRPYQVLRAPSGRRALDMLRTRQPDLMLLDLIMPKMDGFQVLHEKRQDVAIRDIPVIVVSSQDAGGEAVVSNSLTVSRGGGVSAPDLLACIQSVSEILAPSVRPTG